MKMKCAPFGIGPTDVEVDTEVMKEKGKAAFFIALGGVVLATEVALRYVGRGIHKTADGVHKVGDKVDAGHDVVVDYANAQHLGVATKMSKVKS